MAFHRSRLGHVGLLTLLFLTNACGEAGPPSSGDEPASFALEGPSSLRHEALQYPAQIVVDREGLPHIFAESETDLTYLQGYVHARDRLFQMDVLRRQAEGTLAELLGAGPGGSVLMGDVQLRTIGVRRAAERSLLAASPEVRAALTSYAAGVNAFLTANPLPIEYSALEITQIRPWTDLDSISVLKLIAFSLSFDITSDVEQTLTLRAYEAAGRQNGFNGTALYLEDTVRTAPFDPASTIPDALRTPNRPRFGFGRAAAAIDTGWLSKDTVELGRQFLESLSPHALAATNSGEGDRGSNEFVVSGRHSVTGQPLIAGDPHLATGAPAVLYQLGLSAPGAGIDAVGASFAGVPYIVLGNNDRVGWSSTISYVDVTDAYQERIVTDPTSPSGLSTVYKGQLEHVIPVPQSFRFNVLRDGVTDNLMLEPPSTRIPPAALIVPRRNQGPIVRLNAAQGMAISIQFTGFSGTRELDAFRGFTRARSVNDFARALDDFDFGSQNYTVVDTNGDIAYFLSGEIPLREDLQAGQVSGAPPMFIRDGQGGNEWVEQRGADPKRAVPYEILPTAEMPRIVNPPRGYLVNANNDPSGTTLDNDALNQRRPGGGILYLGTGFDSGIRASRITQLLDERLAARGRLTTSDLKAIQADTVMNDARYFTPVIVTAFANARKAGAHAALQEAATDPRVVEAVARLAAWDQSTPTGIRQGYDSNDTPGALREPSAEEIQHSVAATIYSVWRNQFLNNTVVATLNRLELPVFQNNRSAPREVMTAARNLLDNFEERRGVGASGVDFFEIPGIDDAATRRDLIVLRSLARTLDLLAGEPYESAFQRSTNQDDYRWGILHRVILPHPLGEPFSIPPGFGAFPAPLGPRLPGIPVDGGLASIDPAANVLLRDSVDAFTVRTAPAQRYVARVRAFGRGFDAETSLPGGASADPSSKFYVNLLESWLTNETYPLRQSLVELIGNIDSVERFQPARQ